MNPIFDIGVHFRGFEVVNPSVFKMSEEWRKQHQKYWADKYEALRFLRSEQARIATAIHQVKEYLHELKINSLVEFIRTSTDKKIVTYGLRSVYAEATRKEHDIHWKGTLYRIECKSPCEICADKEDYQHGKLYCETPNLSEFGPILSFDTGEEYHAYYTMLAQERKPGKRELSDEPQDRRVKARVSDAASISQALPLPTPPAQSEPATPGQSLQ